VLRRSTLVSRSKENHFHAANYFMNLIHPVLLVNNTDARTKKIAISTSAITVFTGKIEQRTLRFQQVCFDRHQVLA
jgi:hypothetical protein